MTKDRGGLSVRIPKAGEDQPHVVRVAVITVVGFVIGVGWPRLAGVKLVPSAPVEAEAAASAEDPKGVAPSTAAAVPPAAKGVPAPTEAPPSPEPTDRLKLSEAKVTSCRDGKGAKKESCDPIDVDGLARPKIMALVGCPAAASLQGKLSLGIELDFDSGKVTDVLKGKSTNLPDASADALIACAKKEFSTLSLSDVKHQHAKYTVFFLAELLPPGEKAVDPADAGKEVTSASGRATVAWEVAIVRDQPKDGEIVARLMRGTRVVVSGRDGDWYRIKYDAKGAEGWVFRTAIGM
ncbi:MAG: SH3 domain-containing protein [Polyangiaceae bacterium]|nr:SH3 domain-containing protein [Polyangiaceae bacterium]MCE7890255.1 SH3 domain-containing protein [Sorangiineae bacterium PRO1]MCL4755424.1 SH3 domain-containing protein [Myxococcales bacterium]